MLETFLLPFVKLIEVFFLLNTSLLDNYGYSLLLLSLEITLISLPLYILAEKWKIECENLQIKMDPAINDIKMAYTGQKRFYLIKEVHRIFHYNFGHTLKVSFGLLIQIPLFFAAYNYLTAFDGYSGVAFFILSDLSEPDRLYHGINVLPFLMTVVNLVGSLNYLKGRKRSEKIQLLVIAFLFLVLLYNRPSALLLYWTMNNLLAIPKNVLLRRLYPPLPIAEEPVSLSKIDAGTQSIILSTAILCLWSIQAVFIDKWIRISRIAILLSALGAGVATLLLLKRVFVDKYRTSHYKWSLCILGILWGLLTYLLFDWISKGYIEDNYATEPKRLLLFILSDLILYQGLKYILKLHQPVQKTSSMRSGTFIISLIVLNYFIFLYNPMQIYSSAASEIGISFLDLIINQALLWGGTVIILILIYRLLPLSLKQSARHGVLFLLILFLTYFFIFRTDYGILDGNILSGAAKLKETPYNRFLLDALLISCIFYLAGKLKEDKGRRVTIILSAVLLGLLGQNVFSLVQGKSIYNMAEERRTDSYLPPGSAEAHLFTRTGINTLLIVGDMFTGGFMEDLLEENPDWKDDLTGFTWYPDTLSVSPSTYSSIPGILGGWDYAPLGLNDLPGKNRDKMLLSFQPLFENAMAQGGQLALLNPEIHYFTERENTIKVYNEDYEGYWNSIHPEEVYIPSSMDKKKLITMVGLFYASPYCARKSMYADGFWAIFPSINIVDDIHRKVKKEWSYLDLLPRLSGVSDDPSPRMKYMHNLLPHFPYGIDDHGTIITQENNGLQELGYYGTVPAHYSARVFIEKIIKWLDWMKENGVYDNTQIIIVSDHGLPAEIKGDDPMVPGDFSESLPPELFTSAHALLLFKPLNSSEPLKISDEQKSNADCLSLLAPALNIKVQENRPEYRYFADSQIENREFPHVEVTPYDVFTVRGSMFDTDSWEVAP